MILTKLLESPPTYSNFFKTFIHPLGSRLIRKLSSIRTTKERLALFAPLQKFVARGLADQRDELVELGMYEKDDPENFLANPEEITERIMRALVLNDFDFVS
jgi:hypothetical protein